jgi:hypothetical protein
MEEKLNGPREGCFIKLDIKGENWKGVGGRRVDNRGQCR